MGRYTDVQVGNESGILHSARHQVSPREVVGAGVGVGLRVGPNTSTSPCAALGVGVVPGAIGDTVTSNGDNHLAQTKNMMGRTRNVLSS